MGQMRKKKEEKYSEITFAIHIQYKVYIYIHIYTFVSLLLRSQCARFVQLPSPLSFTV